MNFVRYSIIALIAVAAFYMSDQFYSDCHQALVGIYLIGIMLGFFYGIYRFGRWSLRTLGGFLVKF